MKYVLGVWATPLILFWGWYFLSLNDIHFGYVLMTRQAHDLIFQLYGEMIGLDPATIPALVAKACILDTGLILAIWAFRRRKAIIGWVQEKRGASTPCRMKAAAAESMRVWRLRRETSISSSARSAATVERRSSQKANGSSDSRAMLRTKARLAWARGPSLPSMLTGRPMTQALTLSLSN
jgi:hypothetical protein